MAVVSSVLLSVKGAGTKGFFVCVWSIDQDRKQQAKENEEWEEHGARERQIEVPRHICNKQAFVGGRTALLISPIKLNSK